MLCRPLFSGTAHKLEMGRLARGKDWFWLASMGGALSGLLLAQVSRADPPRTPTAPPVQATEEGDDQVEEVVVSGHHGDRGSAKGRAGSKVSRRELEEEIPRSAPDALRYEPGVYVQQTAHGQASPFIRGRTGQQTLLLFDGIRLNNSTYRKGPNQYFFTVDAQTVHSIEVTRGGASTRYGSDAIGGVLDARPVGPRAHLGRGGVVLHPRAALHAATADGEYGYRAQLGGQLAERFHFLVGAGARHAGLLESGGPVVSPQTGQAPEVPAFADDDRTQLGTGFREMTADGRLIYDLSPTRRLLGAAYLYRQRDAPRTDKCPPPFAPISECLTYEEQFRTLAYLRYEGDLGGAARLLRATLSYQRQHERRRHARPASFVENGGRDDVDTFGLSATIDSRSLPLGGDFALLASGGLDSYYDSLDSTAWTTFTDSDIVTLSSRGQYLAGSSYWQGGSFIDLEGRYDRILFLRAGGRLGGARADAPADPESGTQAIARGWHTAVGHVGLEVRPLDWLSLVGNLDRSFRAPNLDDLTSRQQTGPGFQFENPNLVPETALSFEGGVQLQTDFLEVDLWAYRSIIDQAIERATRALGDCPPNTPACGASWHRYQLVNLPEAATIDGFEASARGWLPAGFDLRASVSYAFGQGPNPQERPSDPALAYEEVVPLSRIPPLNGSAELRWQSPIDVYLGAGMRWALAQDRLAPSDRSDARIPTGGTPGFAVVDLRTGYRLGHRLLVAVVLENVGDAAYRYHGSSVNGPGRGLRFHIEGGL